MTESGVLTIDNKDYAVTFDRESPYPALTNDNNLNWSNRRKLNTIITVDDLEPVHMDIKTSDLLVALSSKTSIRLLSIFETDLLKDIVSNILIEQSLTSLGL